MGGHNEEDEVDTTASLLEEYLNKENNSAPLIALFPAKHD